MNNQHEDFTDGIAIDICSEWPILINKISYSGAYLIYHYKTRKMYIGHTCCLYNRKHQHTSRLKSNTHSNAELQKTYNDDSRISFHVIQITDDEEKAKDIEQQFLDFYFNKGLLFNKDPNARSHIGSKKSDETKNKISNKVKLNWKDQKHKKLKSELMKDFYSNPNNLEKHKESRKLFSNDPNFINKQKINANKQWSDKESRKNKSEEVKRAWSDPIQRAKKLAIAKARRKKVSVNNIVFNSAEDVAIKYNITKACVVGRILSKKKPNWFYC